MKDMLTTLRKQGTTDVLKHVRKIVSGESTPLTK